MGLRGSKDDGIHWYENVLLVGERFVGERFVVCGLIGHNHIQRYHNSL